MEFILKILRFVRAVTKNVQNSKVNDRTDLLHENLTR